MFAISEQPYWEDMHERKAKWYSVVFPVFAREAKKRETPFLIEEIREAIAYKIPAPLDGRWWGVIVKAAAKQGLIRKTKPEPAKSSHGSLKPTRIGSAKTARGG